MFHFDRSGIDFNAVHSQNNLDKSLTFSVFHLDISGKDFKDEQL